jgi:DNA repair protein RecO (recombination protein O)
MSSEKTLAIVVRVVEFSESSYVATLFSEDFGKITGLAKGARRAKSAFENALDLLAVSRVVFLRKTSDAMDLLTEAKLERRFRSGARDLKRLYAGFYVAELLIALTDERDPHPALFRMALRTLIALDEQGDVAENVLRFELAMLHSLGQAPMLDRCVECGAAIPAGSRVAFGNLAGGVLCPRCRPGQRHVVSLSARAVELLRWLQRDVEESGTADASDQSMSVSSDWSAALGELRGLMNYRMSHVLGRRPRLLGFLNALR